MYQEPVTLQNLMRPYPGVGQNDLKGYANVYLEYYDYTLMRDINTHLSKLKNVTVLSEDEKELLYSRSALYTSLCLF